MSNRNWRSGWRDVGRPRHARDGEFREVSNRHYGEDEPWREERRTRYPDERYAAETGWYEPRYDEGYGSGYDRGDRSSQPGRRSESYRRDEREHADWWDRRHATGGFGSQYEGWRSGAGFGFGPEERPGGADQFEDTDWIPNRPARGRSTWAGDWGLGRSGRGTDTHARESYPAGRHGYGAGSREDYRGRGPRDYRRGDDRIREDVCDRLTDDYAIDASDLAIQVDGGEVTLTGFVATRDQKRRAEEMAEQVSGVRDVINQLRVNRGESPLSRSTQPGSRGQRSTATPAGVAADRDQSRGNR